MVVTNHTYDSMGLFSTKEMGGGSGPEVDRHLSFYPRRRCGERWYKE